MAMMGLWREMPRTLRLLTATGLGSAMVLSGGLYAVISDQARVGPNSIVTGALPVTEDTLDLQVAQPVNNGCTTGVSWQEASIPGVFSSATFPVGEGPRDITSSPWCLRRVDSTNNTMSIDAVVAGLVETDSVCSPNETAAGDADCVSGAAGSGEVSQSVFWNMRVDFSSDSCDYVNSSPAGQNKALQNGQVSSAISIPPGVNSANPTCVWFGLFTNNQTLAALQRLQTDAATWDWNIVGHI
jgi:hypothetical protein